MEPGKHMNKQLFENYLNFPREFQRFFPDGYTHVPWKIGYVIRKHNKFD